MNAKSYTVVPSKVLKHLAALNNAPIGQYNKAQFDAAVTMVARALQLNEEHVLAALRSAGLI